MSWYPQRSGHSTPNYNHAICVRSCVTAQPEQVHRMIGKQVVRTQVPMPAQNKRVYQDTTQLCLHNLPHAPRGCPSSGLHYPPVPCAPCLCHPCLPSVSSTGTALAWLRVFAQAPLSAQNMLSSPHIFKGVRTPPKAHLCPSCVTLSFLLGCYEKSSG